jgi:hypothetical protein
MSLRTLQWCYLCNYKLRKNKSPSESHNRNCSNRPPNHLSLCDSCFLQGYLNQQDIGCNQALRGRISHQCSKANTRYCQIRGFLTEITCDIQWSSNLINDLWTFSFDCWNVRNKFLFGESDDEQIAILSTELDKNITKYYNNSDRGVHPNDRSLFPFPGVLRIKHHTLRQKLLWIKTVETSLHAWDTRTQTSIQGEGAWLHLMMGNFRGPPPLLTLPPTIGFLPYLCLYCGNQCDH